MGAVNPTTNIILHKLQIKNEGFVWLVGHQICLVAWKQRNVYAWMDVKIMIKLPKQAGIKRAVRKWVKTTMKQLCATTDIVTITSISSTTNSASCVESWNM